MVSGELGSAISGSSEAAQDKAADFFDFQLIDQLRLVPGELQECFPFRRRGAKTFANQLG